VVAANKERCFVVLLFISKVMVLSDHFLYLEFLL
jgi:hypothetical protein